MVISVFTGLWCNLCNKYPQGYHHLAHGEPMDRLSSLPPMTSFRQSGMHHGQSSPYLHSSVSPPLNGSDPMGKNLSECLLEDFDFDMFDSHSHWMCHFVLNVTKNKMAHPMGISQNGTKRSIKHSSVVKFAFILYLKHLNDY